MYILDIPICIFMTIYDLTPIVTDTHLTYCNYVVVYDTYQYGSCSRLVFG